MQSNLSNLAKINFYFPEKSSRLLSKKKLVDLILEEMRKDGMIKYAGYRKEEDLKKGILQHIGNGSISQYKSLTIKEKQFIQKNILSTLQKCNKKLPLPTKNFIFIFPWLPTENMDLFQGSLGYAPYDGCVLHIFIVPGIFTKKSLANSIAHEINHAIWSYHNPKKTNDWSLLDYIINEGLAENFREDVLNTKPAPWAVALSKKKAFSALISIKHLLNSKSRQIHQKILFGDKKYQRWTGYSIGYWLVKDFRRMNKKLSWEEVVKTKPENILNSVIKNRAQ